MLLVAALAGCRSNGGSTVVGGGADMTPPAPMCASKADCFGCCSGSFASGALDYDSSLMTCACTAGACLGDCAATVCGTAVGVDKRCRDCLAMTLGDGGVCRQASTDCLTGAGPCAAFADCVASCPH